MCSKCAACPCCTPRLLPCWAAAMPCKATSLPSPLLQVSKSGLYQTARHMLYIFCRVLTLQLECSRGCIGLLLSLHLVGLLVHFLIPQKGWGTLCKCSLSFCGKYAVHQVNRGDVKSCLQRKQGLRPRAACRRPSPGAPQMLQGPVWGSCEQPCLIWPLCCWRRRQRLEALHACRLQLLLGHA